jgi:NAD+ synthetase
MPCFSNPEDAEHAELLAKSIGIEYKTVQLDKPFTEMVKLLTGEDYDPGKKELAIANIKPRLRMTTLYYYATRRESLVVGTGNRSELTVGYFTKHGDGGVDLLPIGNLVKKQVIEMAKYLEIPSAIINKPPSAGLWAGQTDEKEMGIMVETAVYKHIVSFYQGSTARTGYFRKLKENQKEVDVVIELPKEKILCEVKYRNDSNIPAIDAIVKLADDEKSKVTSAFVITKKITDYGISKHKTKIPILRVPALPFLYLIGKIEAEGNNAKM